MRYDHGQHIVTRRRKAARRRDHHIQRNGVAPMMTCGAHIYDAGRKVGGSAPVCGWLKELFG